MPAALSVYRLLVSPVTDRLRLERACVLLGSMPRVRLSSQRLWLSVEKPSPAFFHEVDRRKRPRRGPGWRFLSQHPPHPAADHFIHSLLTKEFSSRGGRWSIDPLLGDPLPPAAAKPGSALPCCLRMCSNAPRSRRFSVSHALSWGFEAGVDRSAYFTIRSSVKYTPAHMLVLQCASCSFPSLSTYMTP